MSAGLIYLERLTAELTGETHGCHNRNGERRGIEVVVLVGLRLSDAA